MWSPSSRLIIECLYTVDQEKLISISSQSNQEGLTLSKVNTVDVGELNIARTEDIITLEEYEVVLGFTNVRDWEGYCRSNEKTREKICEEHIGICNETLVHSTTTFFIQESPRTTEDERMAKIINTNMPNLATTLPKPVFLHPLSQP
ncbi:hypothetical protein HG531_010706 [Fusarium graminearum]|nr:hypothetical protein HG531_010706 [Fusarium graminearum]